MTERDIFIAVLQRDHAHDRQAYLAEACGSDAALRARVAELLSVHDRAASFLESPAGGMAATAAYAPVGEAAGAMVGPYKLIEAIGEGGFGVVFLAEQQQPVRRKVALKVLKPGMDSRQVVARFEAERQALALMDHPNIARVFDGGATREGRPFFVMELVRGLPVTDFCDQNQLPPRDRLHLFVQVCQAVQHAHQKGVIHRDIKPSNVLVSRHDTTPVVKVIDFGVAKALGRELTDKTLFTGIAQMIGTPLYMSPEQAGMSDLDVDTRSDIYSLGVLLYELLTGTTPFEKERFKQAAYDEIRRIIREEEPPKPSTRLSDSTESLPSISAQRHTEPAKLTKLVRGELDWIVMKALEKDRSRRYETANGFAADVQRYLAGEAVQAVPPSAGYRLQKFARRNKGGLAVATLVLFFLVLLGSGAGWAVRDRAARHAKVAGQVESILSEVDQLEREQKWPEALAAVRRAEAIIAGGEADAATAERVRERLRGLEFIDRLEQIRMRRATWIEGKFDDAGADRGYARAFREYGVDMDELAVETSIDRLKARPALAIPLAAALDEWADARFTVLMKDADAWRWLVAVARGIDPEPLRDGLRSTWGNVAPEVRGELRRLADSIDIRAQHPATVVMLATRLQQGKQGDAALRLLRDAQLVYPGDFWLSYKLAGLLDEQKDHEGAVRFYTAAMAIRPTAAAAQDLGNALSRQNKLDEAIAAYRKAIELDPKFAGAFSNLGLALRSQKKLDAAIAACRKAIELDPQLAAAFFNLGNALRDQKKLPEAIDAFRKAIELDPNYAIAFNNLGNALRRQKKLPEAIAACRKAIELDPEFAAAYSNLGAALWEQKKLPEAIAACRKAIELDPQLADAFNNLGLALNDQNDLDAAIAAYRKAIELDPEFAAAYTNLGRALRSQKKLDAAIAACRKAIELDPKLANAFNVLGAALSDQKKLDAAIASYRKAIELDPQLADAFNNLGNALRSQNKLDAAIAAYREAIELDPQLAAAFNNLGNALSDQNKLDAAIAAYRRAIELDPQLAAAFNNLGLALSDQKKLPEAIAAYHKAIELDPKSAAAHHNLGNDLTKLKKVDQAIAAYRKAIELNPKNADSHNNLGALLLNLKEYDQAIKCFRTALELNPNQAHARRNLLAALARKGLQSRDMKDAAGCLAFAAEYETLTLADDPDKLYDAACLRALCASAIVEDPKTPAANAAQRAREQADLAMAWLHKAVAAGYKDARHMKQDKDLDPLRDREDFKKLVAAVEDNDRAWKLATDSDPSLRDPKRAVELAEKAVAELPQDANCWNTLGVARYRAGDYKGAVVALMKYRELRTNDAEWTNPFFLAMAHWKLDHKDEAARWYKLAVEWMERKKANSEMMRRVRAEAAELLAVEKKKD